MPKSWSFFAQKVADFVLGGRSETKKTCRKKRKTSGFDAFDVEINTLLIYLYIYICL